MELTGLSPLRHGGGDAAAECADAPGAAAEYDAQSPAPGTPGRLLKGGPHDTLRGPGWLLFYKYLPLCGSDTAFPALVPWLNCEAPSTPQTVEALNSVEGLAHHLQPAAHVGTTLRQQEAQGVGSFLEL